MSDNLKSSLLINIVVAANVASSCLRYEGWATGVQSGHLFQTPHHQIFFSF